MRRSTDATTTAAGVDLERMRRERFARAFGEMERREVDALVLGRAANARYVSDARRLWVAGTRPFAPGCVVLRATGQVYLLSATDDGIPAEIPRANLYCTTWNPEKLMHALRRIPGLAEARRVGIDAATPLMNDLLPSVVPRAELVNGEALMLAARRVKTRDEIACLRSAIAITEAALDEVAAIVRPGCPERHLAGVFHEAICRRGATIAATDGIFCATPRTARGGAAPTDETTETWRGTPPPLRGVASDRVLEPGDLVVLSAGVLHLGYEGDATRTCACPPRGSSGDDLHGHGPAIEALHHEWQRTMDALVAECRAGRSAADLRRAYERSGAPPPVLPLAYGVGLGVEPPIVGAGGEKAHEAAQVLEPDMVLSLQVYAWRENVGGYLGTIVVRITERDADVLTASPVRWDAGSSGANSAFLDS